MTGDDLKVRLKIELPGGVRLGYGKVDLLRAVEEHQSISAAARSMGMSYRRAWLLIDELNHCFDEPVIETSVGGRAHGGAVLTATGHRIIDLYQAARDKVQIAIHDELDQLASALVKSPEVTDK
ncbi:MULTISPECIES: winged helix-turn-helix domain-containing protein [Thalassospira]|uniref:Winged helix-turn-helix domain-containing protein n=1 Tax=Thalassospira aquimaris TaxID=3037796 RepID=A0ABT6GCL6_9PROT|nr:MULTISPECIES: winged helix-turn-helix domain-containing protein [Thalassospira]MDG4719818.1 winged helix-turn-helix domain-containing protein [Thalassospira sp. FZY0004]